jgi:hypothetical protein
MWMTNGKRFDVRLAQFAQILGLTCQLDIPKKRHSGRVMMPRCHTPVLKSRTESSIRVPRMFKSHA